MVIEQRPEKNHLEVGRLLAISLPVLDGFMRIEPREWSIEATLLELGTEVGSLGRCITIWEGFRHGRKSRHHIGDELSDVIFVLLRLAKQIGCSLESQVKIASWISPEAGFHELLADTVALHRVLVQGHTNEDDVKAIITRMLSRIGQLSEHYDIVIIDAHEEEMRHASDWQTLFFGSSSKGGFFSLLRSIVWYFRVRRHCASTVGRKSVSVSGNQ